MFVKECCQEIKMKLITFRKLHRSNILRIELTYHFEYTATAHNAVAWRSG